MKTETIDTEKFSEHLRSKAIEPGSQRILLSRLTGSSQENDLSNPVNCDGFGRLHTFRRFGSPGWPENPLPILPACRFFKEKAKSEMVVQVYQNAACNWRCWYCFVDYQLLAASRAHSAFFSAEEIVDKYLSLENRPRVIDLSGGQPDLVPEWVLWMLQAIEKRGLDSQVFLWSDDNLSNDYFWRYLSDAEIAYIAARSNYARVCCFKGFNEASFAFNTKADASLFGEQFGIFKRLKATGIDLYAYATLIGPDPSGVRKHVSDFVDRLQSIHANLPLRTIPLEIKAFSPVIQRMKEIPKAIWQTQHEAIAAWNSEIESRFSEAERQANVYDVAIS